MISARLELIAIVDIPESGRGMIWRSALQALRQMQLPLVDRDIVIVAQKIVSKAEGRLVRSKTFPLARLWIWLASR